MLIAIKEKIEVDENVILKRFNPDPFGGLSTDRILLFNSLVNGFQIGTGFSVVKFYKPFLDAIMNSDEMEPAIQSGDIVTVDTSDKEYVEGELYALFTEWADTAGYNIAGFDIRRLYYDKNARVAILKWDNKPSIAGDCDYTAVECGDVNEIILGRVKSVKRSL